MTIQRMGHVGIVADDLAAATAPNRLVSVSGRPGAGSAYETAKTGKHFSVTSTPESPFDSNQLRSIMAIDRPADSSRTTSSTSLRRS
jgi:hypothetical protein